jgi:hypothetical protein
MIDPILSLAFSVHSNPGVYALLLGSGVSRTAGIPTGWEVVLDLVKKLASIQGKDCEPDAAAWYTQTYGEEPDYSKLLDMLAKSPADRSQLLKGYFEPTPEEQEQGLKTPTAAHRAIANLVAAGYIRVIVTTNFDRLLEMALESVGIVPTVISTADAVEGALPLTHTKCSIIKIHGDYLDTRIKNTPTELGQYDERLNKLLDRVFDEFGLIVCGWSGDWDPALRAAIERCPSRRFTTYWAARREPKGTAKDLLGLRSGVFIQVQDADSFFQELEEKVTSLAELTKPHPLSAKVAVATLKRYLVDDRHRIRLHDLVNDEVEKLYGELSTKSFSVGDSFSIQELLHRMQRYESLAEVALAIMANGCYWGEESYRYLWVKILDRIANPPKLTPGLISTAWERLRFYPALLLLYTGGIAALASGQHTTFAALLTQPTIRDDNGPFPLTLNTFTVIKAEIQQTWTKSYTPLSNHIYEVLREPLKELLPDDMQYQKYFDRFEYLLALVHAHLKSKQSRRASGLVGAFGWRRHTNHTDILQESDLGIAWTRSDRPSPTWNLEELGLFDDSFQQFQQVKQYYDQSIQEFGSGF